MDLVKVLTQAVDGKKPRRKMFMPPEAIPEQPNKLPPADDLEKGKKNVTVAASGTYHPLGEETVNETYTNGLMYFLKYLKAGLDPHDFAHELELFFEHQGIDAPDGFDPDAPYDFLETEEFEEIKDEFVDYLKDHMAPDSAMLPTYLFLTGAKLVPRQTWLIHFSDDAADIARNGFEYGAEDFTQLGLTTHFSDKVRKRGPGWNFAFIAGSRDARNALKGSRGLPKYGRHAVLFQSAGVQAYHEGDQENQVVFWGPAVQQRYLISYQDGVWDISTGDGRSLYSDEDIDNVIGWVKGNHQQYKHQITNDQISKRPTSTPTAKRQELLNKPAVRMPLSMSEGEEYQGETVANYGGWTVQRVDGKKIRDDVDVKFIGGDNPAADSTVCPKKTIWIEKMKNADDESAILIHELVEYYHMEFGAKEDYEHAHEQANKAEQAFREGEAYKAVLEKAIKDEDFLDIAIGLFHAFETSRKSARAPVAESVQVTPDDVGYWSSYAKGMTFPSERAARDWLFSRLEKGSKAWGSDDSEKNREMAERMPLYQQFGRWKIGMKLVTKASTISEDDIEVEDQTYEHVATSGLVAPGDIERVDKPVWVPIEDLVTTEDHTETKEGRAKAEEIARSIRRTKKLTALWVDADDESVMDGHHRLEACKILGLKKVPVQYVHLRDL